MSIRIGIDVGGTFTDVTAFDDERRQLALVRKYSSDPKQPMRVMREVFDDLAKEFGTDSVELILHGSTAALNTLLEDNGVRVGLITTRGFRDVYEIGRQWRGDQVFNIFAPAPKMLLDRERVREVTERLDFRGDVLIPLDRDSVRAATEQLVALGVQGIAVAFLFAYANPAHEIEAAEIVRATAPGLYVSLSCEVNPEWREYERVASTVANTYIGPPVSRYLQDLEDLSLERFPRCRTLMMKSDGGAASAAMLARTPIQTVMSGPVAGVIGSRFIADLNRIENVISFDVGGTSSDMAVIPGHPLFKSEIAVGRHPLRTRTVDIDTIGAGGGSIASVQLGGVLKVGPQSAGAWPGPACYDRGGTEPTLTDALVVLGHLSGDALLDGAMPISRDKAHQAVMQGVGHPLGMTAQDAAWGILTVLASNCTTAMRTITVERGYGPREFTLVPFGGMGPTIAGRIAGDLGIGRILVPNDPGIFSAWGMLVTDVHQERSVTRITRLEEVGAADIEAVFADMEVQAHADLARERFPADRISTLRTAGMRYRGQSYEVAVPVKRLSSAGDLAALVANFHAAHKRRYGHMAENESVEIVNYKVVGVGALPKPDLPVHERSSSAAEPVGHRTAFFGLAGALIVPIFRRADLRAGMEVSGPAVIEEQTSTIVLYPGQTASVDVYLNLLIDLS